MLIDYNGRNLVVTSSIDSTYAEMAVNSLVFRNWLNKVAKQFGVFEIMIRDVDFHGNPSTENVMFVRLRVSILRSKREQIVELRGHTSVMLFFLDDEGPNGLIALLKQARLATGMIELIETPAGMIDDGTFRGSAARELEEELGMSFQEEDLTDITGIPESEGGIFLSPGILDESCRFYFARKKISQKKIQALQRKTFGVKGGDESITVKIVRFEELPRVTRDAKTLVAWTLYKEYMGI